MVSDNAVTNISPWILLGRSCGVGPNCEKYANVGKYVSSGWAVGERGGQRSGGKLRGAPLLSGIRRGYRSDPLAL